MSEQDDWQRFKAMMTAAGWKIKLDIQLNRIAFFSANVGAIRYYPNTGVLQPMGGKPTQIGTWREWLKAGQPPPPW